ncbi:MAG: hypothetical protein IT454_04790 [Planctomycetes bacterium]|nr:hypothetical protein [Planctomycetota bacterium]
MNVFRSLSLFTLLLASACAGPGADEVVAWRSHEAIARPLDQRGQLAVEVAAVESARQADDLARARRLTLSLAAENPQDPSVQLLASRAESDGLFLFEESDKASRNLAALSALHYASDAFTLGAQGGPASAQLAWTMGTTTHLQPMFERAAHARRTLETAQRALSEQADEPTALATLAIVHLRLQTLPWIADLMAFGAPDSSLEEAESFARRACEAWPSRENKLILAKVLVAADKRDAARRELESALAAPVQFPRDTALEAQVRKLHEQLAD